MQNLEHIELYNSRLLATRMREKEWTPEQLAERAGVSQFSVNRVLAGVPGTLKVLRQIADALDVDWAFITQVDLPESDFHRAVLPAGNSKVAR